MFYCRCCQSLIVGWGLNSSIFWGVGAEENHDSSSNRRMVVGQSLVSLVGRWSIIDLGESRIFLLFGSIVGSSDLNLQWLVCGRGGGRAPGSDIYAKVLLA